ncbi:class I SAM-dependent methyltransferase [Streptomyces sp. NPDC101115]|uniref:class I SAM-dependent methyltransferase n=1 Tax=Streptomyces sp. NPDC101115 TaxID=3366106 RepID=UPI0037FF9818
MHELGLDALGVDLSPAMIEVARRDHPGLEFRVGSVTDLDLGEGSLGGLVAWYSLIHVPEHELGRVLAGFRRALRPDGPLLLAFHVGDGSRLKTEGYGGHPMRVRAHLRRPEELAERLAEAGFAVEAVTTLSPAESRLGAIVFARRERDQA